MKLAMQLTFDGMVRGLRGLVHDLADELEHDGAALRRREAARQSTRRASPRGTEARDDESRS